MLMKLSSVIIVGACVLLVVLVMVSLLTTQNGSGITGSAVGIPKDCTSQCRESSATIDEFERCINESCTMIGGETPSGITGYVN